MDEPLTRGDVGNIVVLVFWVAAIVLALKLAALALRIWLVYVGYLDEDI